jgi:hypothetical protein
MVEAIEGLQEDWLPEEIVLGTIKTRARAEGAAKALLEAGFPASEIAVFRGKDIVDAIQTPGGQVHPFLRPLRLLWGFTTPDDPQLMDYEEESRCGTPVVAVHPRSHEDVAKACQVLDSFGACRIKHFSHYNVRELKGP